MNTPGFSELSVKRHECVDSMTYTSRDQYLLVIKWANRVAFFEVRGARCVASTGPPETVWTLEAEIPRDSTVVYIFKKCPSKVDQYLPISTNDSYLGWFRDGKSQWNYTEAEDCRRFVFYEIPYEDFDQLKLLSEGKDASEKRLQIFLAEGQKC